MSVFLGVDYEFFPSRKIEWTNRKSPVRFYEFEIINNRTVAIAIEFVKVLIHLLPWFFALGLYSQLKTFLNFMTEQIEFHVFGGSGSAGVTSSLVSLGRSFTAFIILLPIMYYACENDNKDALVKVYEFHCSEQAAGK